MQNFIQDGKSLDHVAGSTVLSGDVVVMGQRVGIAAANIAAGDTGAVKVEGVYRVPLKSGDTPSQGALLYWDSTNFEATVTSTSNTLMGYAVAASSGTTVLVKING